MRVARILTRWQDNVAVSYAVFSLLKFSVLTAMIAHWFGAQLAECSRLSAAGRTQAAQICLPPTVPTPNCACSKRPDF